MLIVDCLYIVSLQVNASLDVWKYLDRFLFRVLTRGIVGSDCIVLSYETTTFDSRDNYLSLNMRVVCKVHQTCALSRNPDHVG